jgi:hypothetical protein
METASIGKSVRDSAVSCGRETQPATTNPAITTPVAAINRGERLTFPYSLFRPSGSCDRLCGRHPTRNSLMNEGGKNTILRFG